MILSPPREDLPPALLSLYPVLGSLPRAQRAALGESMNRVEVPAGALVFREGQTCSGFPLILAGTIKVVKSTHTGRELLLYRVEPGASCIITSSCLLGHAPYSARGISETALSLRVLPREMFESLIADSAPFRDFVFHLYSARIAELMQLVEEVAFQRLDRRLAKLLLAKAEAETIRATHQALADDLGSVREIVSRLLKGFAEQGLVTLGREQVGIVDRRGLQQVADSRS